MTFAADCLSNTGSGGVSFLIIAGLALMTVGGVAVFARKSWLAKTALLLAPLLLIAGLTISTPTPAQAAAAGECTTSTSTPTPTVAAVAPLITNDPLQTYSGYQGDPFVVAPFTFQITASGDAPVTYAFVDPTAASAIHLTIDATTGLITETGALLSTCGAVSTAGGNVFLDISVTNAAGTDVKTFLFYCDS